MSCADVTYEQERQMSNDMTRNLPNGPSFEERVFARFDALDAGMARMEERQERTLAETLELREDVHTLDRKFNIVHRDLLTLQAEQTRLEDRMEKIDSKPA
jgi:hypothetical protein